MYIPKYFSKKECFPKEVTPDWRMFDERILISADKLREIFGPLWVNGRGLSQCGYRTNGSKTSQHCFGRALDLHTSKYSYREIREYILRSNQFPLITFLEVGINWLHISCQNCDPVQIWSPKRGFISKTEYLSLTNEI